jgi:N-methylhydantoinase B
MPGGGGWGDPLDLEPAAVARDFINDCISERAASDLYGVTLDAQGQVDVDKTRERRLAIRKGSLTDILGEPAR